MSLATAIIDGVTETEAKERTRIAKLAADTVLTIPAPGSSASLSLVGSEPTKVAGAFRPGDRVRVILEGASRSCTLRAGAADVSLDVQRVAVRAAGSLSELIQRKQKGL